MVFFVFRYVFVLYLQINENVIIITLKLNAFKTNAVQYFYIQFGIYIKLVKDIQNTYIAFKRY